MRSVRLPIRVPQPNGNARMGLAIDCSLRFRGPPVAAESVTPRGVRAVSVVASSRLGAGCVNRHRSVEHQVPRRRSSSSRQPRGLARSSVSAGSSVELGGDCRCHGSTSAKSFGLERRSLLYGRDARKLGVMGLNQLRTGIRVGSLTTASSARESRFHFDSRMSAPGAHAER